MFASVVAALLCAITLAADKNIEFGDLAQQDLNIQVEYSTGKVSCSSAVPGDRGEECATLSWDDDDWAYVSWSLDKLAPNNGRTATALNIYRCFSEHFTVNRKWRKPKAVIRKDKQCKKIETLPADATSYNYTIPSDTPEATYFFRILVKCSEDKHDFCGKDDNDENFYLVDPMESIPTGLVVGVIVAIILAPTFLVVYFTYEFAIKKQA
eukprot:TRINITY_DN842_c1_g1_i6.p3 TRINITY_DN842_c1_g1~~TRINITY_DN842_c1_g1_i6.p3  ORF type:complete len:210 (-),score=28.28 TRINITY_DN842_c1_g1_i6:1004-1633(-)